MLVLFSYNKPSTVRIHDRNIKIPVGIKKKVNSMTRHPRKWRAMASFTTTYQEKEETYFKIPHKFSEKFKYLLFVSI